MARCSHCHEVGKIYVDTLKPGRHCHEVGKVYADTPPPGSLLLTLVFWGLVAFGLWLKFGGYASIIHWLKGWL